MVDPKSVSDAKFKHQKLPGNLIMLSHLQPPQKQIQSQETISKLAIYLVEFIPNSLTYTFFNILKFPQFPFWVYKCWLILGLRLVCYTKEDVETTIGIYDNCLSESLSIWGDIVRELIVIWYSSA